MKSVLNVAGLSLLLLIGLASSAQTNAGTSPPASPGSEARQKIATDFVDNMVKGDYEAAQKDFAKSLKDVMTVEKLKDKWVELKGKIGEFQKVEYTKEDMVEDNYRVKKRCQFADQSISVILQFNEENQAIRLIYKY